METDDDNIDFEEQLRLEKEEAEKKSSQKGNTRVDPDGTTYEWDAKFKAWFPKVDEDFLAQYQMTYGINPADDEALQMTPEKLEELRKSREQDWKDYYTKCQEMQPTHGENTASESSDQEKSENKQLFDYYNSDAYREWYAKYMATQPQSVSSEPQATSEASKPDSQSKEASEEHASEGQALKKKRKAESTPVWYELNEEKNTHVYVQNLPLDITDEEFVALMSKCGMLMYEPFSNKPRAKLYRDDLGNVKGDGRCCYIKIESVDLALQIIDGYQLRGTTISVSKAKFQLKGDFDPQKRRKLTNKEKKKIKIHQENLFRWGPEKSRFEREKRERALVLKNVFTIEMLDADPLKLTEIRDRITSDATNCGEVKRIVIHDNNAEGVAIVWFSAAEQTDTALSYFNKSIFYNGRVLHAEIWDGKTKYDVVESEEERAKRLALWETYLEGTSTIAEQSTNVDNGDSIESSTKSPSGDNKDPLEKPDSKNDETPPNQTDDSQDYSTDSEFFEGDSDSEPENAT